METEPRFVARRPNIPQPPLVELAPRARRTREGNYPTEFGMLADFVADSRVTDIFVNGSRGVWVDCGAGPERIADLEPTEAQLRELAVRLMSLGGRHIDESKPNFRHIFDQQIWIFEARQPPEELWDRD
jgi:pilus assembly protein CpaF